MSRAAMDAAFAFVRAYPGRLDPMAQLVLLNIADRTNAHGVAYESTATMARTFGVDRDTVWRATVRLDRAGLLHRTTKRNAATIMVLTLPDPDTLPDRTPVPAGGDPVEHPIEHQGPVDNAGTCPQVDASTRPPGDPLDASARHRAALTRHPCRVDAAQNRLPNRLVEPRADDPPPLTLTGDGGPPEGSDGPGALPPEYVAARERLRAKRWGTR